MIISGGFELGVITTEVDSLRDQRNRVLLKSLLARGNCTHVKAVPSEDQHQRFHTMWQTDITKIVQPRLKPTSHRVRD